MIMHDAPSDMTVHRLNPVHFARGYHRTSGPSTNKREDGDGERDKRGQGNTTVRVYRQSARVPAADSATADPADSLPPHCSQLYIRPDPEREFPFSDFSDFNTNSLCSINRFYSSPDLLVSPVKIHTLARIGFVFCSARVPC